MPNKPSQSTVTTPYCVVTQFNENINWLSEFNFSGQIYAKGKVLNSLKNFKTTETQNYGGNQMDICRFIFENYDNLPDTMAFIQGEPFDHCNKEYFLKKMETNKFSSLETYTEIKDLWGMRKSIEIDNGFSERNTNWYIYDNNEQLMQNKIQLSCKFQNYDDFMASIFDDYKPIRWIRFCPGSQYIVEKWRCHHYSKSFWEALYKFVPTWECKPQLFPTENCILERALWYIFVCIYSEKKNLILSDVSTQVVTKQHLDNKIKRQRSAARFFPRLISVVKRPDSLQLITEKFISLFGKIFRYGTKILKSLLKK